LLTYASPDRTQQPVTRTEILAAVRDAFNTTGPTGAQLVTAARTAGARPALITALGRIPQRAEFRHVRELWAHLPDLPVK
jgi:hypothetical protein